MWDFKKLNLVYDSMVDEQSKNIFDARLQYAVTGDRVSFYEFLNTLNPEYYGIDIQHILNGYKGQEIILYGAGRDGKHNYDVIQHSVLKGKIKYFCDSDEKRVGNTYCGIPIYDIYYLKKKYENEIIIVSSARYGAEIYSLLARLGLPQKNIYLPSYGRLFAAMGKQYFDVFQPNEHEVFVDAGCYDGYSSIQFSGWCQGKYDKIYAFEPIPNLVKICKKNLKEYKVHDVVFIEKATGCSESHITFNDDINNAIFGASSTTTGYSGIDVEQTTIDSVLNGNRATFLKFDVEGAELASLKGAEQTIKTYKPRLAISIYHKPEDIVEIPIYLKECVSEYKFVIRHYSSDEWETILYAYV